MSLTTSSTQRSVFLNPNNRLFELARRAKWLPTWYVAIIIAVVITIVPGLVLQVIFSQQPLVSLIPISALLKSADARVSALGQLLSLVITYGARILVLVAWIKLLEKRPFWTVGLERKGALVKYLRGILLGMAMYGLVVGILALTGSVSLTSGISPQVGPEVLLGVLLVLPGWLIQGAGEECVARGWLLPTMGARYRPWIGILIASIMFAFFHAPELFTGGFNVLALIALLTVSLFLAAYVLYEKSLWGAMGWHAAWNWTEGNLLASLVSGHSIAGGALVKLVSVGPTWMTGGVVGPEGGIPVIAVLALGLLVIIVLARRRTSTSTGTETVLASSPN